MIQDNNNTEIEKLKRLLYDLTPGGSEFYNDPEYCAKWIREDRFNDRVSLKQVIMDRNKEVKRLLSLNEELKKENERMLKDQYQNGLLCVEFGYKQCEKGNNIDMAFLNFNKLTR